MGSKGSAKLKRHCQHTYNVYKEERLGNGTLKAIKKEDKKCIPFSCTQYKKIQR